MCCLLSSKKALFLGFGRLLLKYSFFVVYCKDILVWIVIKLVRLNHFSVHFQMKELAQNLPNPHLMTIATLTGHACLAAGTGYSVSIV